MLHLKEDVKLLSQATGPHGLRIDESTEAVDGGLLRLQHAIHVIRALENYKLL